MNSLCETSLLIYRRGSDIAFLHLYVDDIMLIASFDSLRKHIIFLLANEFAMKDLGMLHYFLGIVVSR